ncbi:MAG: PepSY domain-containing protein, partial [Steroidobacteraceae bacterium]
SVLALFLLVSGLPWTPIWGTGFKQASKLLSTAEIHQDWTIGASEHSEHSHRLRNDVMEAADVRVTLDEIAPRIAALNLAAPVRISPPTARSPIWAVRGEPQNRTLRVSLDIDAKTGAIVRREDFANRPLADRIVGIGVAAHEGQLFAPLNQALGVLTAASLLTLSTSAMVMWWRRRPHGALGAPAVLSNPRLTRGLAILVLCFGLLLPVLGASLVLVAAVERLVLRRIAATREWLGLETVAVD